MNEVIYLIIVLVVIGVGVTFVPMDDSIRKIVIAIVAIAAFLILLTKFMPGFSH